MSEQESDREREKMKNAHRNGLRYIQHKQYKHLYCLLVLLWCTISSLFAFFVFIFVLQTALDCPHCSMTLFSLNYGERFLQTNISLNQFVQFKGLKSLVKIGHI